jgi:ferrochelatase
MTIETLLEITQGSLTNSVNSQEIYSVSVQLNRVDEGDLFISDIQEDILTAIDKKAGAIIYSGDIEIQNNAIVLIKVESIKDAALKLLKYINQDRDISFSYLSSHESTFFKMIVKEKRSIEFIPDDWKKAFEKVLNSSKKIFIGEDKDLIQAIAPKVIVLKNEESGYVIEDTLFRTTFRMGKYVYQGVPIPPFHVDHILKVVAFCEKFDFPYSMDKIQRSKHFIPIFTKAEPTVHNMGRDDKIVIICDNKQDITEAKFYVKTQGRIIAKTLALTPPKTKIDDFENPIYYRNINDIIDVIEQSNFNYLFIYTKDSSIIEEVKKYLYR